MNIPDHTVIRRLGQGGFGEVWLAKHDRLQREHAVKRLCADRFTADGIHRLEQEAQFMSRLPKHRNRVQVFDLRRTPDGVFLMMEYVDGESLHNRLLPWDSSPCATCPTWLMVWRGSTPPASCTGTSSRPTFSGPGNPMRPCSPTSGWQRAAEASSLAGTPGYVAPEVGSAPSGRNRTCSRWRPRCTRWSPAWHLTRPPA